MGRQIGMGSVLVADPPAPAADQTTQRVPCDGGDRESRERKETQQEPADRSDPPIDVVGDHARHEPGEACRDGGKIEIVGHHVGDDADQEGDDEAESDDQDRHPLHVEPWQAIEAGQRHAESEQGKAQCADAEQIPQSTADPRAERPGQGDRQEREPDEEAQHQRGDRREVATRGLTHGEAGAAAVIRRSWKIERTG